MNQQEILQLARKAGFYFQGKGDTQFTNPLEYSERCFYRFADEIRRQALEEAAQRIEGGHFLHDEAPDARLAHSAARAIRALAQPNGAKQKCKTCDGRGEVGELTMGGYETHPCPCCTQPNGAEGER